MSLIDTLGRRFKVDANYIAKGTFWLVSGSVAGSLLSIVVSFIIARYVPKETFGVFKYILSMTAIAGALSLSGINTVVTRSVSQGFDGAFVQALKIQARWATLQFVFLLAISGYYFFMGNMMYGVSFLIASICMPVSGISNTYGAFLAGKKEFRTSSYYALSSNAVYVAIFGSVAMFMPSLIPLVAAYFVATTAANIFFCLRTMRKYKPNNLTQPGDEAYAMTLSFTNAFGIVAGHIDSIIVYQFLGPVQLAIYNFAMIIPDKMRTLSGFIQTIALPKLSEHKSKNKSVVYRYILYVTAYAAIVGLLYAVVAPYAFKILFPNYMDSVALSQLYTLSFFAIPAAFLVTVLSAYKMQKQLYTLNIFVPFIKIGLLFFLVYGWGLVGAVIAKIIGIFIQFILLLGSLGASKEEAI